MKKINTIIGLLYVCFVFPAFAQTENTEGKHTHAGTHMSDVLLSFDAIFHHAKVELSWYSDSENRNTTYTIEKSKDSLNFEVVTTIKAYSKNTPSIMYFDVDYKPFEGISYYRLTQTNAKGIPVASRLIAINNRLPTESLAINQTSAYVKAGDIKNSNYKDILVVLRSKMGIESYSKIRMNDENNGTPTGETANLELGTYTVVASSDNRLFVQNAEVR